MYNGKRVLALSLIATQDENTIQSIWLCTDHSKLAVFQGILVSFSLIRLLYHFYVIQVYLFEERGLYKKETTPNCIAKFFVNYLWLLCFLGYALFL